ncbi:MAG: nucleoside deaminase [Bacteroides sp.]|nr:nucleoside deaminase [Eubacterium sp.]MCM1419605.1 nucleoside deaminase [Roseburia sp.]MCM1463570.1 nucleoside deaminase [Bacteroides sp.]
MLIDEERMYLAIEEAKKAASLGEVPVGAIVVDEDGKVVGRGHNVTETENRPTGHAEILAIEEAARSKGNWRLSDCTLYVTLEPCPMCAGAAIRARLKRVVYGAFDESGGALASVTALYDERFGCKPLVRSRILERECGALLSEFFQKQREREARN